MHTTGAGQTDRGLKRERNEDAFLIRDEQGLYIVSDGMGGHAGGDTASSTAVETVARHLEHELDSMRRNGARGDRDAMRGTMEKAVNAACGDVFRLAQARAELAGMGCTLSVVQTVGAVAVIGHVGDSRVYLLRAGSLHRLSNDHTVAGELFRKGAITEEQTSKHLYKNVLSRVVGRAEAVQVDTLIVDLLPEDRLLLCSDGFSGYVPTAAWLAEELDLRFDAEELSHRLVDYAREQGGSDNITVIVVDAIEEPGTAAQAEVARLGLDALSNSFLFEDLPLRALSSVLSAAEVKRVRAGSALVEEGAPTRALYLVVDGKLSVERAGQPPAELIPGDSFGETTLMRPRQALATVRATEDSIVLGFARSRWQRLTHARPWLGVRLLDRLAHRMALELDRARQSPDSEHRDPLTLF